MDKVLEALERLKTAPTFMGGTPEYQACKLNNGNFAFHICDTRKEFLTLEEFEMLKKWLKEKEQYV